MGDNRNARTRNHCQKCDYNEQSEWVITMNRSANAINFSAAPSYPSAGRLLRKNCSAFEIVVGNGGDMPRRASGMQIVSEARPERSQ